MAHAETLFSHILDQAGTRLPSDRRFAARRRTPQAGIHVNAELARTIEQMAPG